MDPAEQEHKIASQTVLKRALELDPSIILLKSVGSMPEGRLTELSDFDFIVFSLSSWFNITTKGPNGKLTRQSIHDPRNIHVHWHNLQNHIGITREPNWNKVVKLRLAEYIHCFTWYGLLSEHAPIYITDAGQHLVQNARLFVNRKTVQIALDIISKVHDVLSDIWVDDSRRKHSKHARANLQGLQMCEMAIKGNLTSYDVTTAPYIPTRKTYYDRYNVLHDKISNLSWDKVKEYDSQLTTDLLHELQRKTQNVQ